MLNPRTTQICLALAPALISSDSEIQFPFTSSEIGMHNSNDQRALDQVIVHHFALLHCLGAQRTMTVDATLGVIQAY